MCYYDQHKYECGDWKWGNFKMHCHAEYRMGETCGMKLINHTYPVQGKCRICEQIERKKRRYDKTKADFARWREDPDRKASAQKAWDDMTALAEEIQTLVADLQSKRQNVGNNRRQQRVVYS